MKANFFLFFLSSEVSVFLIRQQNKEKLKEKVNKKQEESRQWMTQIQINFFFLLLANWEWTTIKSFFLTPVFFDFTWCFLLQNCSLMDDNFFVFFSFFFVFSLRLLFLIFSFVSASVLFSIYFLFVFVLFWNQKTMKYSTIPR